MGISAWKRCLEKLEGELSPQQFNTWIRPLHAIESENTVHLLAPNRFVLDWVSERHLMRIEEILSSELINGENISLKIKIGSRNSKENQPKHKKTIKQNTNTFNDKQQTKPTRHSNT